MVEDASALLPYILMVCRPLVDILSPQGRRYPGLLLLARRDVLADTALARCRAGKELLAVAANMAVYQTGQYWSWVLVNN